LGVLTRYPLYLFLQFDKWQQQKKPARITGGDVVSIPNAKNIGISNKFILHPFTPNFANFATSKNFYFKWSLS
jgi:hypothetical protein